jgi:hypothetical protein
MASGCQDRRSVLIADFKTVMAARKRGHPLAGSLCVRMSANGRFNSLINASRRLKSEFDFLADASGINRHDYVIW